MRLVTVDENTIVLNTMWLPTWLGCNGVLTQKIEEELQPLIVGREITEKSLDEIQQLVIDHIQDRFPELHGLWKVLDAIKYLEDK